MARLQGGVDIVVDRSITGEYVVRVLDQAARFRGAPAAIRTDQGPEFTGKLLDIASMEGLGLMIANAPRQAKARASTMR